MSTHMRLLAKATAIAIGSVIGFASAGNAIAQEKQKPKVNAVGVGSAWQGTLTSPGVNGSTFDDSQLAAVQQVNAYFNGIKHLRGRFAQTDAQNRTLKGKFYVQWPGRFRFDYSRPSRLVILSDGRHLRIEDLELKNTETYGLASTPFGIILARNVDILRDARVLGISQSDKDLVLSLRDKKEDTGVIQLQFKRLDDKKIELAAWIITDAQGLDTRIAVSSLIKGKKANPKLFKGSKIGLPTTESRN